MQLAHLAEMEVKHRCNQVMELGFPLGGIAKLFAQDWEGDVTVVMPATLAQVYHVSLHMSSVCSKRCNISLKFYRIFQIQILRSLEDADF